MNAYEGHDIELKLSKSVKFISFHNFLMKEVLLSSSLYKNWDTQELKNLDKATELVSSLMTT